MTELVPRRGGVVECLVRLARAVPGVYICPFPGDEYEEAAGHEHCPSVRRLCGLPDDNAVRVLFELDRALSGVQQFPTVLKAFGLIVSKKEKLDTVPGSGTACLYYRLPGTPQFDTPRAQLDVAFDTTFPSPLLARVRNGEPERWRGAPEFATMGIHRGGALIRDELLPDEEYGFAAAFQRKRRRVQGLPGAPWYADIEPRYLRGARRRPFFSARRAHDC
mmetsp:Transcript_5414/g.16019  ORF Transcript_5414/g.16019 Transcript_5414/m.16019 type:complete len:220 (+) Transcript_5414:97-756(+)